MVVINTPYTLHHDIYRAITVTGGLPLRLPFAMRLYISFFVFASLPVTKQPLIQIMHPIRLLHQNIQLAAALRYFICIFAYFGNIDR